MCGILGLVGNHPEKMPNLDVLGHRGPDGNGVWDNGNVWLGHCRLAIQDLSSNGVQPMQSRDGRFILIFNGEIYNHWDIRQDLESKYVFTSTSDAETLLYGFVEYGKGVLDRLNGIYAFAIYDRQMQKLTIARDPMGVKPLYYSSKKDGIFFSSELKALLPFMENKNLSVSAIANYLTYLWSPGEETPFEEVKKLLPGHVLEVSLNDFENLSVQLSSFYQFPFRGIYENNLSEMELVEQLDQLLRKVVERQLLSDVPIGFFLSGGLDSSLIVAIAKDLYPEKDFDCFTINTGEDLYTKDGFASDWHYAKLVASHLDVRLHTVNSDVDILSDFDRMIWSLDEPQADPAPLNVLNICKIARDMGIKVLIGGSGGDDVFSGYRRHQALSLERVLDKTPLCIRILLQRALQKVSAGSTWGRRVRKLCQAWDRPSNERLAQYFSWLPYDKLQSLLSDEMKQKLGVYDPLSYLYHLDTLIPNEKDLLNRMLHWELRSFLVDHNLNYTDKMGMAVGVEIRVPFLDLELIEFAAKIPPRMKMKGMETKYILKKVAERYLPKEVIYRPKTGFGAPARQWVKSDLIPLIQERLAPERLSAQGLFNPQAVWTLIENNRAGKIDASYTIWSILAIDSWVRQFRN